MRSTIGARTAQRYAEQFAWSIARGHFASVEQSKMRCCCGAKLPLARLACSCGAQQCASPGCHPVSDQWAEEATSDGEAVTRLWRGERWWPIALTGLGIDAVVVQGPLPSPGVVGVGDCDASLGLTLTWRDEWHAFLAAPGALDENTVQEFDGVTVRGTGGWIPLPAVALHSPARWVTSPLERRGLALNTADALLDMLASRVRSEDSSTGETSQTPAMTASELAVLEGDLRRNPEGGPSCV